MGERVTRRASLLRHHSVSFTGNPFTTAGRPLGLHSLCLSITSFGGPRPRSKRPTTHHRRRHRSSRPPATRGLFEPSRTHLAPPHNHSPGVYVPMLMRPWVLHTCHSTTSRHLGVSRTLGMLRRFYWWIGKEPAGGSAAASSARRARLRAKRFAGLPFPCRYQTAPASSSASTSSALYLPHPGATLTCSFSPTASAGAPTCSPLLRLSSPHPARPTF